MPAARRGCAVSARIRGRGGHGVTKKDGTIDRRTPATDGSRPQARAPRPRQWNNETRLSPREVRPEEVSAAPQPVPENEEQLRHSNTELAVRVAELEGATAGVQNARRAALNLMEDAILSRQAVETLNVALRESGERHRVLFESSPHATFVFDAETLRFTVANEAALKLYGYSEKEFLSLSVFDIRPPEDVPVTKEIIARLPQSGRVTDVRKQLGVAELHRHRRKDGSILFVEPSVQEILFNGRRAWLTTIVDITERKQAEAALRAQTDRLETLNRIAKVLSSEL